MPGKVVQIQVTDPRIIAPCGINCSLCRAYIRARQPCPGCRGEDTHKANSCVECAIKKCDLLAEGDDQFCYSCSRYPCPILLQLDKRYGTRYGVGVIANLESIEVAGVERFISAETIKWSCPECGSRLCMHKTQCVNCGFLWRET